MAESLRLFLVEDDDGMALLVRRVLERAGHQVTCCHRSEDAIIVLHQTQFDLVILDWELDTMDALTLLEDLQRDNISPPALIITKHDNTELATKVWHAGALDYVAKDNALMFLADLPRRVSDSVVRHRTEQHNRLLTAALESARDGIAITDLDGTFLHVNQALESMTGYDREELLGNTPRLFKSGRHRPEFYAELWRTILGRASWQGELVNRRKDGTMFDASLTVSPIVDSRGALTHFVGIYRDVGERKQLERQLLHAQKMQSVGTLAGGVAHEFNNLLAGIQGYAALGLREHGLSPALQQFLQYVIDLSDRAANLTRQLLAFARKPALSRQPTSMETLLRNTVDLVRHSLSVGVELELPSPSPGGEPLAALADSNQLQQVLVNLALNARDAMSQPQPIVFRLRRAVLTAEQSAFPENIPPGDYVVVEVQDQGSGMSPEVLNQALDPFFTTKDIGQGTGLGLPVAFGIVHGHQGYLTIQSRQGEGTTVRLYLPRLTGAALRPGLAHLDAGRIPEPDSVPGRSIIVVDDEQAVLDVVRRFLEIAGHQVIGTTSGREALALLDQGRQADLVVLDLMIPQEEGSQTFDALRLRRPRLPVLLCTGLLQADPAPRLLQESGVSLLRKPFRMNELWYAVNKALAEANGP
jgi:PAS domain S-box-containing protein